MAIVNVAEYQTYTGTTLDATQTAYVTSLIPIVQNQVEIYCDRLFDEQDYSEWYKYSRYTVLRQYPVNHILYIGSTTDVAEFDDKTYTYEIKSDGLYVTDTSLTTTTVTFGGAITTLTDIKTAIEAAIPAITLTIVSGFETMSYKLLKVGTGRQVVGADKSDAQTKLIEDENRTVEFITCSDFSVWYNTDYTSDVNLFMVYNAGYAEADMPAALKMIVVNIIKDIMSIQGQGSAGVLSGVYQQESITNYSYALASGVTWNGSVDIASIVMKYSGDLDPFVKKVV